MSIRYRCTVNYRLNKMSALSERRTFVLIFVIFLIAQPSPDLRWVAATTHPYAPWPSSLTNLYSESTTKVELRAVKLYRSITRLDGEKERIVAVDPKRHDAVDGRSCASRESPLVLTEAVLQPPTVPEVSSQNV